MANLSFYMMMAKHIVVDFTFIVPCIIIIVSKNNQHDDTCGLSFIFRGSRHSLYMFRAFGKLIIRSSFSCTVSLWYSV